MSSAVKGCPSDHFIPGRRWNVNSVEASLTSQACATFGSDLREISVPANQPLVADHAQDAVVIRASAQPAPDSAAIGADAFERRDDERLPRQPLRQSRQFSIRNQLREGRRLFRRGLRLDCWRDRRQRGRSCEAAQDGTAFDAGNGGLGCRLAIPVGHCLGRPRDGILIAVLSGSYRRLGGLRNKAAACEA